MRVYQIGRLENGVVRFLSPPEQVAIKLYQKELVNLRRSRDGHDVQEDPLRELAIQQRLSNPGHGYVMPLLAALETADRYYAIFPYVRGGELFDYVQANAPLPEATARVLFRKMLDAVYYCHLAGVCHRDISLENFLLGGDRLNTPLLIDFGLSVVMEPAPAPAGAPPGQPAWRPIPWAGTVGKMFYLAPEMLSRSTREYSGTAVDVWSLGICLFICVTGVPPFQQPAASDDRFRAIVLQKRLAHVARGWGFRLSDELCDLLQRILDADPAQRLSVLQIASHPWLHMSA